MDLSLRLDTLLNLAEDLGIEVRAEPMGGSGGGICRLRGQRVLFVDTDADLATRYDRTLIAMATLSDLDDKFIIPEIRADIDRQRQNKGKTAP